jgi:hypothetical protein
MAFAFGDGFDCYAAPADAVAGYWDSGTTTAFTLGAGRFSSSQCIRSNTPGGVLLLVKSSAANDAIHHIVCAFQQTIALAGTNAGMYLQLSDGATAQCSVVFRSDGAILLTSGGPTGTTLATYTTGVTAQNAWTAFEFEVVINGATGSFTVRKNGNASNDFTLGSLNTRGGTANNYANRLTLGWQANIGASAHQLDDLLWRSDASSVPWVGDIRCYTRMPAADVSVQFARSPATLVQTPLSGSATVATSTTIARYTPFVASFDGAVGTVTLPMTTGYTGNLKCSIFASTPGGTGTGFPPTTVLGSATPISNPTTSNTFTFSTPVTVSRGVQYWVGFMTDAATGTYTITPTTGGLTQTATSYAAFPTANPTTGGAQCPIPSWTLTIGSNATLVNETQQDGATSYVYDANPGDADFYSLAPLAGTPASTIAVTTRGYIQKSDAGTRTGAVQLRSGGTTVSSTATNLSTSWGWLYRMDQVDPATGSAWSATAVNNATIGPVVVS